MRVSHAMGADAIELNFSCPHMDRVDMGANVGKDAVLCSVSTQAVKAVAKVPVWVKLTPATADIVEEGVQEYRSDKAIDAVWKTQAKLRPHKPRRRTLSYGLTKQLNNLIAAMRALAVRESSRPHPQPREPFP